MGVVYRAQQRSPFHRFVALKLIKSGINSRQVIRRFEGERQALAMMDHPAIAKILDAGDTADGRPYFAMELVDGIPLTDYCNRQSLNLQRRLELFTQVCDGVQHAHQKGIIHRDLKPSNILVTLIDGQPQPKIIDFGLAKALDATSRLSDESRFTEWGQVLGTIKYMSPEQAGLGEVDIDTRTDIYALGVILYELLTGTTPLDGQSLRGRALLKVLELVRSHAPLKPSSRISEEHFSASEHTLGGDWNARRLRSVLIGDLDWITMKALENDRGRRYPTAASFAEDVRRFLADQPVAARPPSFPYIISKTIRRHKLASAAVIALAAGLSLTLASALYGWRSAQKLAATERRGRLIAEAEKEFEAQYIPLQQSPETFSRAVLATLESSLLPLQQLDPRKAQGKRDSLLATLALGSKLRLASPNATADVLAGCRLDLQYLQQQIGPDGSRELAKVRDDLQRSLAARQRDWVVVVNRDERTILPQQWEISSAALTGAIPPSPNTVPPPSPPIHAARLAFSFDPADAPACRSLRWSLLETPQDALQTHGYSFELTLPKESPPQTSLASAAANGQPLQMQIRRGAQIIRLAPIDPPATASWKISAEIDARQIRVSLNETLLHCTDLFSISTPACTATLSADTPLEVRGVRLDAKPLPQQPTLIDQADADYLAGRYLEAASRYAQVTSQEGRYKAALCQRALQDETAAVKTLEALFASIPAIASADVPWHMLAGLELFLVYQERNQHDQKHQLLTRLITDYQSSLGTYLPILPHQLADQVITHARRDGARWRLAIAGQGDVIQLRFAAKLEEALAEISPQRRRATRWKLADALRAEGSSTEAAQILIRLIQESDADPTTAAPEKTRETATLVSDLAWLYLSTQELAEAERLIDERERQVMVDGQLPSPWTPLLTDRARIQIARGDWTTAGQTLDRALEILGSDSSGIPHGAFAELCAVAGLVQKTLGNPPRAQELWERGLRKNWPHWERDRLDLGLPGHHEVNYSRATTFEFLLHSLTGGSRSVDLMENTLADLNSNRARGDELFNLASLFRPIGPLVPWVLQSTFDHPQRAQQWREGMILRTTAFKEFFIEPLTLILYRAARILVPESDQWSEELHQFGLSAAITLVDLIDRERLNLSDDPALISSFLLQPDETGTLWQKIRERYPPNLATGLGLIKLSALHSQDRTKDAVFLRLAEELRQLPDLPSAVAAEISRLQGSGI